MSETQEQANKVGAGSPAGTRWFVSRFPELSITVKPEDWQQDDNGKFHKVKGKYVRFKKEVKPRKLRGSGFLETGGDGTDRNDSVFWGVVKIEDQKIIDFLRNHEFYKMTTQDNRLDRNMKLKELSWNPDTLGDRTSGLVDRRGESLGQDEDPAVASPKESAPDKPRAKVSVKAKVEA